MLHYTNLAARTTGREALITRKYVYYTVYLAKNDRVIAFGLAEDCAKMLGMNKATFFSTVSRAKKGDNGKYEFQKETIDGDEYASLIEAERVERLKQKAKEMRMD